MTEPMRMNVKRVRVEMELEDGTVKAVEYTKIREVSLEMTREPRETTWEQVMPTHLRTFIPGLLIELNLHVTAEAATVSVPEGSGAQMPHAPARIDAERRKGQPFLKSMPLGAGQCIADEGGRMLMKIGDFSADQKN